MVEQHFCKVKVVGSNPSPGLAKCDEIGINRRSSVQIRFSAPPTNNLLLTNSDNKTANLCLKITSSNWSARSVNRSTIFPLRTKRLSRTVWNLKSSVGIAANTLHIKKQNKCLPLRAPMKLGFSR